MEFFNWLFSLNITQCWLLLIATILGILFLMGIISNVQKDTLDSHFDKYTVLYIVLFIVLILPEILLLIYKYDPFSFGIVTTVLFVIPFMFAGSNGTRYDRLGRVVYGSGNSSILSKYWRQRQLRMRRREALKYAKSFISPYRKIFGKLVLSNKYCKVIYTKDKKLCKFFCMSKVYNKKNELPFFEARAMQVSIWNEEFFNSLCFNFSFNTKLENLRSIFNTDKFLIDDTNYDISKTQQKIPEPQVNNPQPKEKEVHPVQKMLEKININEATEAELTALPGVNIVMAKKAIKQRDYNGEFKSVDEFIKLLKIKPHFEKQLREIVVVKPVEAHITEKGERILDLD